MERTDMVSEGSEEKRNVHWLSDGMSMIWGWITGTDNQNQDFPLNIPKNIPVNDLLINVSFPHAASWGKIS